MMLLKTKGLEREGLLDWHPYIIVYQSILTQMQRSVDIS